jgi:hypothetical protein
MGLWDRVKAAFAPGEPGPPDAPRLDWSSEDTLSASLKHLPDGSRGWISLAGARSLFSRMGDQYAFGELDEVGKANLAAFAARSDHRSSIEFMPAEGRVYFIRKVN